MLLLEDPKDKGTTDEPTSPPSKQSGSQNDPMAFVDRAFARVAAREGAQKMQEDESVQSRQPVSGSLLLCAVDLQVGGVRKGGEEGAAQR
ncbi:MAG: hypothetical protein SGPRY_010501 [Prymnesium sp.]